MKTIILFIAMIPAFAAFSTGNNYITLNHTAVKNDLPVILTNSVSTGGLVVSSTTMGTIQFFIFDVEGHVAYQSELKNKESKNIEGLKKGIYTYTVELNDKKLEEGKLIVK